ncbi:MAG TPA: hypothetical protein VFT51_10700 [Bacillales bacterium]|nr:hypothetical protein [Bacillales bacterium]
MKRKLFLVVGIMLALAITGVSYAATSASTSVTVNTTDFATVSQASTTTGKYKIQPELSAEGSSGTVANGDLYIISPQGTGTGDIYGTLYLSNAAALTDNFSFLNFNVQIYGTADDGATWDPVGDPLLLSLTNGYVNFSLTGDYTTYSVSVDGGGFYLLNTSAVTEPEFFVEIK